jgi:cytochrome c peroxidase
LGDFLAHTINYAQYAQANYGKQKVPTLRNVDARPEDDFVKAYGHNGYFKSLKAIVHFYNTRDILPRPETVAHPKPGVNCWPEPEVSMNMNTTEMGNLGLSEEEEEAIVAFLKTLTDRDEDCD